MQKAKFHHVHLNVADRTKSIAFYQKFFGAKPIKYGEGTDALLTEKSFILLDKLGSPIPTNIGSSLWHIGWSGLDGNSEFKWRVEENIEVHTPITPLGEDHWMYFYGPDKELIEVFTGNKSHDFEHIHLLASDIDSSVEWFSATLGLEPVFKEARNWPNKLFKWNYFLVDNINIYVYGKPLEKRAWYPESFKKTKGTVFDHIGFSYENIEAVFDRMKGNGVDMASDINTDPIYGFRSFYINGPDGLLIEVLEENTSEKSFGWPD